MVHDGNLQAAIVVEDVEAHTDEELLGKGRQDEGLMEYADYEVRLAALLDVQIEDV